VTDFLTSEQIADLSKIKEICDRMHADLVIIGATAILIHLRDLGRLTRDIDLTVALDLDDFRSLTQALDAEGWRSAAKLEQRWITPAQTIIDLLPAGPGLRRAGRIVWPESEFEMSLAGFEYVFPQSVPVERGQESSIRVASLPVVALKIVAYMEAPHRRAKDLQDLRPLLRRYEHDSDRLFSDDVFDAELPDFGLANAFLLGLDLGRLVSEQDIDYVERFIERFLPEDHRAEEFTEWNLGSDFAAQIQAFSKSFRL
jgi:predicted nucleotidyltransferase